MACRFDRSPSGFTLLEILISLAVLGLFFVAITMILKQILDQVGSSRVKTTALALVQQKMEAVRNLKYADVGTVDGIPLGTLPQTEVVTINNLPFTITTSIVYIDDPYDGLAPADLDNTDYKRVRIEATWGGAYPSRTPLALVANVTPRGLETAPPGGTIKLMVYDANGQPVPNAIVTIDNTVLVPPIHTQTLTDANGVIELPGSPPCITCYRISVTKSGYSTDRTYDSAEVANPLKPHASVLQDQVTLLSFAIDRYSMLTVRSYGSRESGYPVVANALFTVRGSKIIGYDTSDNPVYKYQYSTNTGGGSVTIPGLEWDSYTLDFTNSAHNLAGTNPLHPFALLPNTPLITSIVAVPKTNTSLLVVVKNASGVAMASVSANLKNATLGFDATKQTAATGAADFGQAFFGGLIPETYDLSVSLPGYEEATRSVTLSGAGVEVFAINEL